MHSYFVGIEVSLSKSGIYISKCKHALEILKNQGFLGARPVEFPMEDVKLSDKGELLKDLAKYQCGGPTNLSHYHSFGYHLFHTCS